MKSLNLFLALFTCVCVSLNDAWGEVRIKIGVSLPLSGGAASEGEDLRKILQFANRTLADDRYELIFEDDRCNNKDAVSVAQKLASIEKVPYVLGYACSGSIQSAAPIFEKAGIVTIGLATGAPEISSAGEFIFRTIPSLEVAGEELASHVAKRFKKIGVLSEETAYCKGLADAFERHGKERGLAISKMSYLPETGDFRTLLLKLKSEGNEAVFLNPQDEKGMITLYRQFLDLGWNVPVYAAYYPGFAEFLKTFGTKADGVVFADLPFIDSGLSSKGKELYESYVRENGKPQSSEFYFVTGFSAFTALHEAISKGDSVQKYLYSHTFSSVFGDFSFDKNGDVKGEKLTFVLKEIKSGRSAALDN